MRTKEDIELEIRAAANKLHSLEKELKDLKDKNSAEIYNNLINKYVKWGKGSITGGIGKIVEIDRGAAVVESIHWNKLQEGNYRLLFNSDLIPVELITCITEEEFIQTKKDWIKEFEKLLA